MTDESTALEAGIAAADGPEKTREYADVRRWAKDIEAARRYDEEARKEYARNRRYARGDTGGEVSANLAGTYIDILESFLYARNPDVDAAPAKACEPPSIEAVQEAVEQMLASGERPPELLQAGRQAAAAATLQGLPQHLALQAGQIAEDQALDALVKSQHDQIMQRYRKRQRDAKAFGETVEILVGHSWRAAGLKRRGRRWVRSDLTIGVGVLKASWQERTAPSPETVQAINDLQDNIKRAAAQRAALEAEDPGLFERIKQGALSLIGQDVESKLADYERQLATLREKPERIVARGLVTDVVQGEDFQVPPGYTIADHCDAPWNAHRIPMLFSAAQANFGLSEEQMQTATRYNARKPVTMRQEAAMLDDGIRATDADAYTTDGSGDHTDTGGGSGDWVMVWEIWDRDSNSVLTMIEGVKCWAKPAWTPKATTRFYPFFLVATSEVDGQRHPQSLVSRSAKLLDEYTRIGGAEAEHRRRIKPKTFFIRGSMSPKSVEAIERGVTQEMVGIDPTNPKADLRGMIQPIAYAAIDTALYDRHPIVNELERIWGIQEALSGSIDTEKTATEAEIQQSGFQARSSGRRDVLEAALQELAQYTAELLHAYMTPEEVAKIAGPNALWPEYTGPESLNELLSIEIRAGSSGKPNTNAERQAWASQLPLLQSSIATIAQLRGTAPADLADCYEALLRITAERTGDRLDVDALIPKAGPMLAPPAAAPGTPGTPPPDGGAGEPAPTEPTQGAPASEPNEPPTGATAPQPAFA